MIPFVRCSRTAAVKQGRCFAASFDNKASTFDTPQKAARAAAVAEVIRRRPWFTPAGAALDVGAGTGLLTLEMSPYFNQVTAYDVSCKMLEVLQVKIAQERAKQQVNVAYGALENLGKFDLIFSLLAFHHIPNVPSTVVELLGHLNAGGRLLIADLLATSNVRRFHKPEETIGTDYEHDGFTKHEVQEWLSGCDDFDWVEMPIRKEAAEGWKAAGHPETEEYTLFVASAKLKS